MDDERVRVRNEAPERADGEYVLYWMTATRRARDNFALDAALAASARLRRPLLVFEALRAGYPWASARLHQFVVEGMVDQRRDFAAAGVRYLPYVEPEVGAGRGLLEALGARACLVVTDRSPAFFLPRMVAAAADRSRVRLVDVDSVGLLPLAATTKAWPSAASFRRHFQREFPSRSASFPDAEPAWPRGGALAAVPDEVLRRWPSADPILDEPHRVRSIVGGPAPVSLRGGSRAGAERVAAFVERRLVRYGDHNHPDEDSASGLSPWLHFGHVSAHAVFRAVVAGTTWEPGALVPATGSREGWWGLDPARESFLDELVTWRELAHSFVSVVPDAESYSTLPEWARRTLGDHAGDTRPTTYSQTELAEARTHDPVWNAAQTQLVRDGVLHNYLRMLWAKKILEWSPSPQAAFAVMVDLNHRYALDGRDPNSTAGLTWCLGRFDRPWFPERPIFGTIRYMSSDQARRKLRLRRYLERYGGPTPTAP